MSLFTFYTYQFAPLFNSKQFEIFSDINLIPSEDAMEKKNEILNDILNSDIEFKNKNKKLSIYHILDEDEIILFKIANKKNIILEKDFKPELYEYEPSVYVLIYNSPDIQRIAIEQNKSVFSDTNIVAKILQNGLQIHLKRFNLSISIKRVFRETEFWSIIEKYNRKIKMIRFQFDYPNLPSQWTKASEMIKGLSEKTHSKESKIELKSSDDDYLDVKNDDEDINDLVKASANTGNNIIFKIGKIRTFQKTGDTIKTTLIENVEGLNIDELKRLMSSE